MTTYVLLAIPFLAVSIGVLLWAQRRTGGPHWTAVAITAVVLVALTAAFDNILVGVGIVGYDDSLTLGVRLGVAPVEDFAYALAAAMLLPALSWLLGARGRATT
jgi:lycopene cyclase domain-containing protein